MKSIGIIALDLDGTLLDSQKRLSGRNKEMLHPALPAYTQDLQT